MKKLLLTTSAIFCFLNVVAQNTASTETKDSIPDTDNNETIRIRCGSSIRTKSPLVILNNIVVPYEELSAINPRDIIELTVLKPENATPIYGSLAKDGCIVIATVVENTSNCDGITQRYPFKVYCIEHTNLNTQQDIYNAIRAKVPGVQITNTSLNQTPKITMRGDLNTMVIVDGIRFDASLLNRLNPADIESIKVVNDVAGSNYFLNGRE